MIHQLLSLTRPLFVLDTETTGTDPSKDRIVEVGFQQWDATGLVKEWKSLVNPGVSIPASATKVHHITNRDFELCRKCHAELDNHPIGSHKEAFEAPCIDPSPWPTFKQLTPNLAKGLVNCDYAGKNVRFDLRILSAEFARAGVAWNYLGARIIDAERLEQLAEPRSLSHLHQKYTGVKHDGAHGALSDVRASTTVIVGQLQKYPMLPRDLDHLHAEQWPGWIDTGGTFRFVDGVACVMFGKHRGKPMKDVPRDYWDWLLSADFPSEVKALASAAKLGQFPEAP